MTYNLVIVTAGNKQEAEKIVRTLLEEKLIACGSIIDNVSSMFWWQNKIEEEQEVLVIMKTQQSLFKRLSKRVTELHSYDVPEILAVPIADGLPSYLDWLKASLEPVKK
jgi:periplasmic divalent cation tolerance protein